LQVQKKILAMADDIISTGLRMLNEPAEDTLTATQVAKTFNMSTLDFNAVLSDMGIQYRAHGRWYLAEHLQGRGFTAERTHINYSLKGKRKIKVYMTWTMAGLKYLNSQLGYPNL
jgi:phage antirepressor YoqD-like protein